MAEKSSKLKQFAQGTLILTISNLLIKATNFFLLPLYTEYLTPDQLGISDSITSLMSLLFPILVFSFDAGFSAFYYEEDSEEYRQKVFNTVFFFLVVSSFITLLPIVFAKQISVLLFGEADFYMAIAVAMFSVALNMWFLPFSLRVRMQNRMTTFSVISFVASFSMIVLNILFVTVFKMGYFSLILSNCLVHLLQLVLFSSFAQMKVSLQSFDKELFKKILKYSLPMVPMVVSGWLLSVSDRYVMLYFCGSEEVGLYGVAARFQSVMTVVTNAIYTAYASFAFSSQKDEDANKNYSFVLDAVFVTLSFIAVTVSAFSKELVGIMATEAYGTSFVLVAPLLFGQVCYAANTILGYGFAFSKKSIYYLIPSFSGAIINVVLNILFVPTYGAYAAAITTFFGYFVMVVLTYVLAKRVYECDFNFFKLAVFTMAMFVALIVTADMGIIVRIVVFATILCALIFGYIDRIKFIYGKVANIKARK